MKVKNSLVSKKEVLRDVVKARAYMIRHYEDGITLNEVIDELAATEAKIIKEEALDSDTPLFVDVYAVIKNSMLNRKFNALKTTILINEYICGVKLMGNEVINTSEQIMLGVTVEDLLNAKVEIDCYSMNSSFIEGLTKYINDNYKKETKTPSTAR